MGQGGISARSTQAKLLHKSFPGGVGWHLASLVELRHLHPSALFSKSRWSREARQLHPYL